MFQEFISFCEAMELVPEEELETSTQGGPNSFADRRAKKVFSSLLSSRIISVCLDFIPLYAM